MKLSRASPTRTSGKQGCHLIRCGPLGPFVGRTRGWQPSQDHEPEQPATACGTSRAELNQELPALVWDGTEWDRPLAEESSGPDYFSGRSGVVI